MDNVLPNWIFIHIIIRENNIFIIERGSYFISNNNPFSGMCLLFMKGPSRAVHGSARANGR